MSLAWIREHYPVPAFRGRKVAMEGIPGVIVGSEGPWVKVRLERPWPGSLRLIVVTHPMVHIDYDPPTSEDQP